MKKTSSFCLGLLGIVALSLVCPQQARALDSQYLRNGECYLLIGEGATALRGVYRLNNPAAQPAKYYKDNRVISGGSINNTLGFNVDLNRKIYTFTENVDASWQKDSAPIYRQVVDTVPANDVDYGYHAWIHYDHRQWGKGDIYRTGPAGRRIKNDYGGWWSGFNSAGPGTPVSKPSGYTLPAMRGAAQCGEYSGKQWYQIPNYSWYSSWRTGTADPYWNGYYTFYYVYGDRVQVKNHNYYLWTWTPSNAELDTPSYSKNTGNIVAKTKEEQISRDCLAGCLDGCGGASGSGSSSPKPLLNDIAFQPPLKDQGSRTYFYSRTQGGTDGKVTKNNTNYNPGSGNPLIGARDNTDTFWLCISLRNTTTDFVYCLGTSVIKDWYKQAFGSAPSNMNITAVTVSNQWDQQGGIVYAYDKANKKIYKFERKETSGTPISKERFLALDLSSILSEIDAVSNSEFDDIKADGFGSLYFAMSHPSKNVSAYNPAQHFKPSDCIHLHPTTHDNQKGEQAFLMIFKQDYGKKVFERNYLTGEIKEVGSKDFASRIYNVSCKIKDAGWNVIKNYPSGCSFSRLNTELASWSATVAGYTYKQAKTSWPSSYYQYGRSSCKHYSELNYNDPGQAKLAVINVPTPPRVISLGGKKSYLDIVGPYHNMIPLPDKIERSTNQGDGLLSSNISLEKDQLYFYMVENYPLDDGAQDPTVQSNWDNDGRMGGFITSIQDPAPYRAGSHSSGVQYEWKTWMVMDLYANCVCRLIQSVDVKDGNPYNFIYSPVYGKFIMTCRVKYNWYDYDALTFGSTVDDLSKVLHTNEYAIPVAANSITAQWASDRLNQIKNNFKFTGQLVNREGQKINKNNVSFMSSPFNQYGEPINIDYSTIVSSTNGGQYLALESISIGADPGIPSDTPTITFPITRCDDLPGVATSSYMNNDSYWSSEPSEDKTFGIAAGEVYNWRIDKSAQAHMFKDISRFNSINPNDRDYNYLAHRMLTPPTSSSPNPFYVNGKANFKFMNQQGDLKWADKKILVSAKLLYKVPSGNSYKEVSLPLKQALDTSSSVGSDYEFEYTVKDETNLWQNNIPVYYTTAGNLPPTDPMDARIQITMRRQYHYDMWAYYNGQPSFAVKDLPGWFKVTGEAKIRIIDTTKPKIAWGETKPNNLFGITGGELKAGVGPNLMLNPNNINFTVTDNNPWEGVEVQKGLTIDNHIRNINYNYGYSYCQAYCSNNEYLSSRFKSLGLSSTTGIRNDIESKKRSGQKTSHLNYKSLFSRQARDVRLGFETVMRINSTNPRTNGRVTLGKADSLYYLNGTKFSTENGSKYAIHYRGGNGHDAKYQQSLTLSSMSTERTVGATTVYDARMVYSLPVNSIEISPSNSTKKNQIPDGYANNTPGYRNGNSIRPYKFYVSLTDSSGNYTGERELNVVLNVKDDIPPVGYGSITNGKDNHTSYFPSETSGVNYSEDLKKAPSYRVSGEYYYFSQALNSTFLRGANWASNDSNGFVKYNNVAGPYKAMIPLGDKIQSSLDEKDTSVFFAQVRSKLPPQAVEDNVECQFNVYVSDNCGNATATLSLKQFDTDGRNGSQHEVPKTISTENGWISAANVDGSTKLEIASSTRTLHTLFRGNSTQFPMAIPITIVSEDDARDWDYYNGGSEDEAGNWTWGTVHFGGNAKNKRTFKTSLPVFGSELDIRTLDKTIQNQR